MYKLVSFIGQDDADILGPFLTHYRKLGVGEFHLIIHGTWAAADLAPLRSKDVKIAGVAQDPFDVVMKTSTIEDYATTLSGGWLIVVDADEFLELPYASLNQMTATLDRIGVEELPALLLQRAAADGSLPTLPDRASLDAVFPCYDYLLAERMNVPFPIWKSKYPLVRFGPQSRLSRGHHLPSTGRPSAHVPIRGILHHFKWRDRLLRSISRIRGESSNQREQDAYRFWLEAHEFRLPTVGLKPYSRSALFQDGHLVGPTRPELSRLSALQKARRAPWALHGNTASALRTLRYVLPAAAQDDKRASSYLDRVGLLARPGKIALVTSDILGMRRTGGIGTAVAALAERLAGAGHEVHVYLSPFAGFPTLAPVWFRYWEARGVRIRQFSRRDAKGRITTTEQMSLILSRALAEDSWDVIHFPDAGGMGAATLLLRAAGLAFEGTQIAVTVHGPTRWHRGGNLLPWNSTEAESTHLEGSSIDLADVLIFPSAYMMRWTRRHFSSPAAHVIIPNSLSGESRSFGRISMKRRPVDKVVFFGRIELRKGVDRFIAAIEAILASGLSDFEVIFLGSLGPALSEADLRLRIEHWTCSTRLLVNYTTHDAVDLLRTDNCLAVIPSRVDNSPYTVYECLENGVPFIASDVGGIRELIRAEDRERVLVSDADGGYATRLLDALRHGALPAAPSFNPDQADLDLLSLHGHLVEAARLSRWRARRPAAATKASVIVYGSGEPGRPLALVLRRWVQDGVEVFWEPDPERAQTTASDSFREARGAMLNRRVKATSGANVLFCHVSVVPRVEALGAMLTGLGSARADAIVCGYQTTRPDGEAEATPIYAGPPEFSPDRNVYGARLFLVRKARFLEVGGFATEPEIADILEWEFLNRLKGAGGRVLAIPAAMASLSAPAPTPAINEYQRGRLAVPWTESLPEPLQGFVRMALHPERKAAQAAGPPAAALKQTVARVAMVPDVRDMGLASLLDRRLETEPVSSLSSPAQERANRQADVSSPASAIPQAPSVRSASSEAGRRHDSPLNAIEAGESEQNELGRLGIASNGRLLSRRQTYFIQSGGDAEGCDFLVEDRVLGSRQCQLIADAFLRMEKLIAGNARRPSAEGFLRFEEMLAAVPRATAPMLDATRRAAELTTGFYGLTLPIYPARLRVAKVRAGAFVLPQRTIAMPRGVAAEERRTEFAGLLCLNDEVGGGECYFPALDIAVMPRRGRLIASTASAYHERAVLRVASGTLLTMSFIMGFNPDRMSPALRRLY